MTESKKIKYYIYIHMYIYIYIYVYIYRQISRFRLPADSIHLKGNDTTFMSNAV